jgi:hypothetical protein
VETSSNEKFLRDSVVDADIRSFVLAKACLIKVYLLMVFVEESVREGH